MDHRDATRALHAGWGLADASLACLRNYWNAVFRVRAGDRRYVLRMHSPDYHDVESIESEVRWLSALARDTDLVVPAPVVTREGGLTCTVELGSGARRTCTLLGWVDGRRAARLGVASFSELGALLARLHGHASGWRRPVRFRRPARDVPSLGRYWFRPFDDRGWRGLDRGVRAVFRRTLERAGRVEDGLRRTHPRAFGLIHADLHRGNLLRTPRGLAPIDFDDCGLGCHLYDLAVPLASRYEGAASAAGAALVEGYRRARPLPDDLVRHLDAFVAARAVGVVLFLHGWARDRPELAPRIAPAVAEAARCARALLR